MSANEPRIRILNLHVIKGDITCTVFNCTEAGSRTEKARRRLDFSLTPVQRETVNLLVDLLQKSRDFKIPSENVDQLLVVLGEQLYQMLFRDESKSRLNDELRALRDGTSILLRVELEFEGPDGEWLSGLPWECLHIPLDEAYAGQFLATAATQLVLNRQLALTQETTRDLPTPGTVRVLLVCSNPRWREDPKPARVDCGRVREAIEALETNKEFGNRRIELRVIEDDMELSEPYQWKVTRAKFKELLKSDNFNPHIIHFIGHGRRKPKGGGQLAFGDSGGSEDWLDDSEFADLVIGGSELKLVFLQACESALPDPYVGTSGVARQIASMGIPAVVAMQYRVQAEVANTFACRFYEALAQGDPVDLAVKAGREAITELPRDSSQPMAFGLPVLYLRSYDSMIKRVQERKGSKSSAIGTGQRKEVLEACPRCTASLSGGERFCGTCRLRLVCGSRDCGKRLKDPLGAFCEECGEPIHQSEWMPKPSGEFAVASASVSPIPTSVQSRSSQLPVEIVTMGPRLRRP